MTPEQRDRLDIQQAIAFVILLVLLWAIFNY
jgi:hypothetical protein